MLRLWRPVARRFGDADALVRAMFGFGPTPLRATEAWFALQATQQAIPTQHALTNRAW